MEGRKVINLFVKDTPSGAMCSSVIHEWARDKYDSVDVKYIDGDLEDSNINKEIHELVKLIHLARDEEADPCSHREIILIDFHPSNEAINDLKTLTKTHVTIHDFELEPRNGMVRNIIRRYFGFWKSKWPHGYRSLYDALGGSVWHQDIDWGVLVSLNRMHGTDELEHLFTAYLHDLKPHEHYNTYGLLDYFFEVFKPSRKYDGKQ